MSDQTNPDGNGKPAALLVDGYGLIFRAFHAVRGELTTSKGEPTNAVFGFAMMLLETLRSQRPAHAVVALEGGRTFRHEAAETYKANRAAMPDELRSQVVRIRELLDALGIPVEEREGYEADDVIGSLAARLTAEGDLRVVILTGDSDMLQLVDDDVEVVLPGGQRFGEIRTFDRAAVNERYGFGPEHVADYKALVGDTSDNIAGVPGIGDKTAKNLIGKFGGVEEILAHLDEVTPPKAKKALEENVEVARESKRLTTIVRELDVALDREESAIGNYDRERVIELFRELEIRTLINRLPEPTRAPSPPKRERPPSKRTTVRTDEELARLVARVREVGTYAVDLETTSADPLRADLVGVAVAVDACESYYVPLRHPGDGQLGEAQVLAALAPVLTDPSLKAYAHHAKYDLAVLRRHGGDLKNLEFDTMIAAFLLGENSIGLKDLALFRLGIEMTEITALIGSGRGQLTMDQVDSDLAADYACGDVEATFALVEEFRPRLAEVGVEELFREIELPLVPVLVEMERSGIAIDVPYLEALSAEITQRFKELEGLIQTEAGRPINVGSNKQLAQLLFEELKLPSGRRTKTGYSVDSDVLENIADKHRIVRWILEYRTLGKLKSTYVDALPAAVDERDGRVHTSYNQTVARTGRLSSTNPNLQNIPIRTELGRRVRRAFVADGRPEYRLFPDAVLLSADYSQIELRLLADMSKEPFLVDAYTSGQDIHAATAAAVYGIKAEEVEPDQRRVAKTVNFGVMYGMQAYGLSRDSGLPRAEAQAFIDAYWARLPQVRAMFDETLRFGTANGYVRTPSGRRRQMPNLLSTNGAQRLAAEREAMNMPVQGTAADIIKVAMIKLDAALREAKLPARILLQVHDELVLELDRSALAETAALVVETMEAAYPLSVPLEVEVSAGTNWEELEAVEVAVRA